MVKDAFSEQRASQARSRSRGHSRSRRGSASDAAVEETKLLLEASVIKFCGTHKWNLLPSSCSVCRLVSRTVKSAMLPELRMLKAKAAAGLDVL